MDSLQGWVGGGRLGAGGRGLNHRNTPENIEKPFSSEPLDSDV